MLGREDLAELGIPSEEEYVADLLPARRAAGASRDWEFYLAFAMFRLAAIAQGIMGRVIAGTANDVQRPRARRARPPARRGGLGSHRVSHRQ